MERNLDIGCFHPSVAIGGFFETGHFAAVMVLSGADKRRGLQQRFVGPRVEPSVIAAENLNVEVASVG